MPCILAKTRNFPQVNSLEGIFPCLLLHPGATLMLYLMEAANPYLARDTHIIV